MSITGAINKNTNKYEYPDTANKKDKYKCPDCDRDVLFRKGAKNLPHFAHFKSNDPCNYYKNNGGESPEHKEGKLIMKHLLQTHTPMRFYRKCPRCRHTHFEHEIGNEYYDENTFAKDEYGFYYNGTRRSADVALIKYKEALAIFEIKHTHETKEEDRPEPWFEISANKLIDLVNKNTFENINIQCKRTIPCSDCTTDDLEIAQYMSEEEEWRQRVEDYFQKEAEEQARKIHEWELKENRWKDDYKWVGIFPIR